MKKSNLHNEFFDNVKTQIINQLNKLPECTDTNSRSGTIKLKTINKSFNIHNKIISRELFKNLPNSIYQSNSGTKYSRRALNKMIQKYFLKSTNFTIPMFNNSFNTPNSLKAPFLSSTLNGKDNFLLQITNSLMNDFEESKPIFVTNKEMQVEFFKKTRNIDSKFSSNYFNSKTLQSLERRNLFENNINSSSFYDKISGSKYLTREDNNFFKHLVSSLKTKKNHLKHYTSMYQTTESIHIPKYNETYPKIILDNLRKLFLKCPANKFKIASEVKSIVSHGLF